MRCPDKLEWNTYLDKEAGKERERRLQAHLKRCSFCRDTVAALRDDNRILKDMLTDIHLPPDLEDYIKRRLLRQERAWWTLKAGVLVLLLGSGLLAMAGWIPLIKWLGAALQSMLGGSLLMQLVVLMGRLLTAATGYVMHGEPVGMAPTFVVLLACLAGLLVQGRKGGYDNA